MEILRLLKSSFRSRPVSKIMLPKIGDIFANLAGGEQFSKVDLRQAVTSSGRFETSTHNVYS